MSKKLTSVQNNDLYEVKCHARFSYRTVILVGVYLGQEVCVCSNNIPVQART
jgi:hypothetical protein